MFRINWFSVPIIFICIVVTSFAWAYDLPRVIGEFQIPNRGVVEYCNIGDQNQDGRFDLIAPNYIDGQLQIYFGDDSMTSRFDYAIPMRRGEMEVMNGLRWIGRLTPDHNLSFCTCGGVGAEIGFLDLYSGAGDRREYPWMTWSTQDRWHSWEVKYDANSRPVDFNGDSHDDLVYLREVNDSVAVMEICFGGADFDSIPDWEKHFFQRAEYGGVRPSDTDLSLGYDVNNDGYDDILLRSRGEHNEEYSIKFYSIYLGGDPPDTIPSFVLWDGTFEGRWQPTKMDQGFTMLPDVNDDGYADFAIYWFDSWPVGDHGAGMADGIYLFFGGEEVDAEPDMILPGATQGWSTACNLTGGDFNGDEKGDIIIYYGSNSPPGFDELNFHFGSRWFDIEPDLIVSGSDYDNEYGFLLSHIGAVGDYNGDNVDDVVVPIYGGDFDLIILAGSRDWRVDVPDDPAKQVPETFDFRLRTFPNPFNESVTITCKIPLHGRYKMAVYDISGRLHKTLFAGEIEPGEYAVNWNERTAGIYLVVIYSEGRVLAVTKTVCLP